MPESVRSATATPADAAAAAAAATKIAAIARGVGARARRRHARARRRRVGSGVAAPQSLADAADRAGIPALEDVHYMLLSGDMTVSSGNLVLILVTTREQHRGGYYDGVL